MNKVNISLNNNKVDNSSLSSKLSQLIQEQADKAIEGKKAQFKKSFERAYVENKDRIETVVLHSESDPSKDISKKISTDINFEETEESISYSIAAKVPSENVVINTQFKGVENPKKEVLNFFGVKPGKTKQNMSEWYMEPTSWDRKFFRKFLNKLNKRKAK